MSVEISFFSLCLRGARLASRLYRCLEYHLYHLAPYALTLVYVIRTVFLYAVPGLSSLLSTLAATTSAYRHLHAQKIMAASSRPTVSPFGRVPRIHFLLLSPASMCRLPMNPAIFLQNPAPITGQSTRCSCGFLLRRTPLPYTSCFLILLRRPPSGCGAVLLAKLPGPSG